ncbi:MAG: aminotransferase class V-fold PLP-dependent enzyme [Clostridia bacterium]
MTVAFPNKAGVINAQQLEKFVSPQTKMLVINCTSNVTGNTCDLASIGAFAKKNNMVFLLDTAQALGHISIDASLNNIDMLAIAGHKGLHGPQGIGALVVKNDINLKPIIYGGNGVSSSKLYMPLIKPEAYECGTLNTPAIIGLKESLIWTKANLFNIKNLIDYLAEKLWVYLAQNNQIQLYSPSGSNVIAFNVKNFTSSEVGDFLNQNDIAVRAGLHCAPLAHNYLNTLDRGAVRVSIGYNNDIRDINLLINALDKLIETSK